MDAIMALEPAAVAVCSGMTGVFPLSPEELPPQPATMPALNADASKTLIVFIFMLKVSEFYSRGVA
ncbi:hypothetical protein HF313_27630 [Massilia atriviolacea]|uniref:Uncharacterized protein n=1 Tax=Massilia atriviolacea TaxID=2495579 RepID=A0A430HJI7_9BURK|nr:hypothetical protein [Massilia atriviolacea]RSZ57670.1 hypothetical protein EJB06_18485 [Massilia atriviolacea]